MDSETRTALIELWRDEPGCRPTDDEGWHLYWDDCWGWQQPPDGCMVPMVANDGGNKTAEALARDAIVCWLPQQANVDSVSLLYATEPNDASTSVSIRTFSDGTRRPKPDTLVFDDPSLLRNLIAAARAVHKGDERGE